ncbi:DnaJ-class molecular chaperone [Nocardiopsis arvandica]|uniref:DnaJ-class molecular chaperone n=1 Tax=Nocardiopsis sinuspersici TaxID=501010 RepID=A0A7Y9XBC9_9ACTN|nr:DnaJ C-terminal domain-containing protein [Nocardiopsis sinuspersici]NYH51140.1 DnaJ-class molecular chaperone [Nocardiopsis sinuspersici]
MSSREDPHAVLGLEAGATREQVVRAFRALARRYHPDSPGGDHAAYIRVRSAYEALMDPRHRGGRDTDRGADRGTGGHTPPPRRGIRIPVRVRGQRPRRGSDATFTVRLDLARAVYGTAVTVALGDGRTVDVDVPAGTGHRSRLRVPGHGRPGSHGGAPGDLVVTVLVEEHPFYRRVGEDLRTTLVLSYAEAVLGARVAITSLDGREVTVPVAPGTAPGATIRLPGQGVPSRTRADGAGALVLDVTVDVPAEGLTPGQRAALEHLGGTLPHPGREPRR